ncbi:MAG: antitoxin [Thermoleophilia bacterium]
MRTLYIRNVPDGVAKDLEALAAAEGLSLNAAVVKELTHASRRARTAALLADLPRLGIDDVIADLRAGRDERDRR